MDLGALTISLNSEQIIIYQIQKSVAIIYISTFLNERVIHSILNRFSSNFGRSINLY